MVEHYRQKLSLKTLGFGLLVALTMTLAIPGTKAWAQDANVLKVSPVRSDITIAAGQSKVVQATVTNLTDSELTVRPTTNDFVSGDETGTPSLILDENDYAPSHSLKRYMSGLASFTIPAHDSRTIGVTVSIPADAQAGGYFGAVRFSPASSEGGGQVNLNASVASIILVTVPGDLIEKLQLTSFDVQQNGISGASFRDPSNLTASFRFENKGNVQVAPFGKISVKQGDRVVYEADFNDKLPRDVVLPDSARRWSVPLENIGTFGYYTVSATLTYGENNQTVEVTKSFWVLPLSAILIAIGALLGLIALIVGGWFFLRSYKRRVLRDAGHHGNIHRHRR